jgi:hypothetical protein
MALAARLVELNERALAAKNSRIVALVGKVFLNGVDGKSPKTYETDGVKIRYDPQICAAHMGSVSLRGIDVTDMGFVIPMQRKLFSQGLMLTTLCKVVVLTAAGMCPFLHDDCPLALDVLNAYTYQPQFDNAFDAYRVSMTPFLHDPAVSVLMTTTASCVSKSVKDAHTRWQRRRVWLEVVVICSTFTDARDGAAKYAGPSL